MSTSMSCFPPPIKKTNGPPILSYAMFCTILPLAAWLPASPICLLVSGHPCIWLTQWTSKVGLRNCFSAGVSPKVVCRLN